MSEYLGKYRLYTLIGQKSNGPGVTKCYNFRIPDPNFTNFLLNLSATNASKPFVTIIYQVLLQKDTDCFRAMGSLSKTCKTIPIMCYNPFVYPPQPMHYAHPDMQANRMEMFSFPADTQRGYNVAATSWRCSDVVTTFLRRCVFTGFTHMRECIHTRACSHA